MMKLVGLVGSNGEMSYNRFLLQFIETHYKDLFEFEVLEIKDVPLFNQSNDQTNSESIQYLNQKISDADGVIIATPEHNRTVPPALKSVIEWLSFKVHPFENQPVLIIGASYYDQGTSRAQLHLRQILESPGVGAYTFPGNEFLLSNATQAFDDEGNLKDPGTVIFLRNVLEKFTRYVELLEGLKENKKIALPTEDLKATGKIETTIEGINKYADDWLEQAAAKVEAIKGDAYVELDRGILTVNQINQLLNSMPFEVTYADSNNQFLYYNRHISPKKMLAKRVPSQVGNPLGECHPANTHKNVAYVIQQLRAGNMDNFRVQVPTHGADKFVVHTYQGIRDEEGSYLGVNEYVQDIQPLIDWYLEQTNQKLVVKNTDGISSATGNHSDAVSGATTNDTDSVSSATGNNIDAVSGATGKDADAVSGATGKDADAISGATGNEIDAVSGATGKDADAISGATGNEIDAVSGATENDTDSMSGATALDYTNEIRTDAVSGATQKDHKSPGNSEADAITGASQNI